MILLSFYKHQTVIFCIKFLNLAQDLQVFGDGSLAIELTKYVF